MKHDRNESSIVKPQTLKPMIALDECCALSPSPALPAEKAVVLKVDGVSKSFSGVPALRNGCLELRKGSVHALCGGNGAGKSTFLNILMGILPRDGGSILIDGKEVYFDSPKAALDAGISIITQELSPIRGMTVAENLYLGREPKKLGCLVDHKQLNKQAGELLDQLGFKINPKAKMGTLSLAETQLVEIAKVFTHDSRIIIMDEPTSAIGQHETELFFKSIRRITEMGTAIIYVTHRMTEIFELADTYTVFRDGAFIESGKIADIDRRHLIRQIIGRDVSAQFQKMEKEPIPDDLPPILVAENFSRAGKFDKVHLTLRPGETVGIYGLLGSGRSEFVEALFGLGKDVEGVLQVNGRKVTIKSPADAMKHGFALVTEDRKDSGLVLPLSVRDNISLSSLGGISKGGFVRKREELDRAQQMVDRFRIKTASVHMPVRSMSGGNQQKVVLARWLQTNPKILLLDEPTRGIDEGAKREIYEFMAEFTKAGGAIIVISSEVEEVLGTSDRILVFHRGRPCQERVNDETLSKEELIHLAS